MSVHKRGDRWVAVVYDPKTKSKVWVGTYDKKGEASEAAGDFKKGLRRGRSSETCDSFQVRWVRDYPRSRTATNLSYQERSKKFAEDFKGRRLDGISKAEAREWVMANRGRHQAVRAMFSDAVRDGLCDVNPFVAMRLPGSEGRRNIEVLPRDEVLELAAIARKKHGPMFEAFVLAAAFTGMRPGELYALRWPAVDFGRGEVRVLESYSSKSRETTRPKNHRTRTAVLLEPAYAALADLRKPDGFVFESHTGRRFTGRVLHYYWDPVRTAAGRDGMHLYELRHFAASYLLNDLGIPPHQVAIQLGHTDGGRLITTLYGHPDERLALDAIKRAAGSNVQPLRALTSADG